METKPLLSLWPYHPRPGENAMLRWQIRGYAGDVYMSLCFERKDEAVAFANERGWRLAHCGR